MRVQNNAVINARTNYQQLAEGLARRLEEKQREWEERQATWESDRSRLEMHLAALEAALARSSSDLDARDAEVEELRAQQWAASHHCMQFK